MRVTNRDEIPTYVNQKRSAIRCRVLCFSSTSPFQLSHQPIRGFVPHLHRDMRVDVGESALPPRRFPIRQITKEFEETGEMIFVTQIVNWIGVLSAKYVHFDHVGARQ